MLLLPFAAVGATKYIEYRSRLGACAVETDLLRK